MTSYEHFEEKFGPEAKIPTQGEWADYESDMDTLFSYRKFFGKSVEEVLPFIEGNSSEAYGYIFHMTDIPFRYYIYGFVIAVESKRMKDPHNTESGLVASSFLSLILDVLTRAPDKILPIMTELIPVAEYVASNQENFRAREGIFGSFTESYNKILNTYAKVLLRGERKKRNGVR